MHIELTPHTPRETWLIALLHSCGYEGILQLKIKYAMFKLQQLETFTDHFDFDVRPDDSFCPLASPSLEQTIDKMVEDNMALLRYVRRIDRHWAHLSISTAGYQFIDFRLFHDKPFRREVSEVATWAQRHDLGELRRQLRYAHPSFQKELTSITPV